MPIYDIKKKKEYDRKWHENKRKGLPTRTTPIIPINERAGRRKKVRQKANQKRKSVRRKAIEDKFGKEWTDGTVRCEICCGRYYLTLHRKDGLLHRLWQAMTKEQFNEMIQSNDYTIICYDCHKHVHWCMKWLSLTWEQISNLKKHFIVT